MDVYLKKSEHKIYKFLKNDRQFYISPYQRFYSWGKDNIETLLNDIEENYLYTKRKHKEKKLWFGTIIIKQSGNSEIEIIDGQQRILTMMLIFKEFQQISELSEPMQDKWSVSLNRYIENKNVEALFNVDGKISVCDISDYISDSNKDWLDSKKELTKIINQIHEYVKKWQETKMWEPIYNYLKQSITVTILVTKEPGYKLFENLNSKGLKLTLKDKCYAFLYENIKEDSWDKSTIDLLKFLRKTPDGVDILEMFIKVYSINSNSTSMCMPKKVHYFRNFKQIINSDISCFFKFLKTYKVLKFGDTKSIKNVLNSKQYPSFFFTYLISFSWKWYAQIFITIVIFHKELINYFLETFWIVDLQIHINGLGRKTTHSLAYETARNIKIFDCEPALQKLKKFFQQRLKLVNPSYTQGEVTLSESQYKLITNKTLNRRIVAIYWLLFKCDKFSSNEDFTTLLYSNAFPTFYSENVEIEHLVPVRPKNKDNSLNFNVNQIEGISNLILVNGYSNKKLSNNSFNEKIRKFRKFPDYVKLENQRKLLMTLFKEVETCEDSLSKIKLFWELHLNNQCITFQDFLQNYLKINIVTKSLKISNIFEKLRPTSGVNNLYQTKKTSNIRYYIKKISTSGYGEKGLRMHISSQELAYFKANNMNDTFVILGVYNECYYILKDKIDVYKNVSATAISPNIKFNYDCWEEWDPIKEK